MSKVIRTMLRGTMISAITVLAVLSVFFHQKNSLGSEKVTVGAESAETVSVDADSGADGGGSLLSAETEEEQPSEKETAENDTDDDTETEENEKNDFSYLADTSPSYTVYVPHCDEMYYSMAEKTCDFSFTNPDINTCYLQVSITRRDTSETIYTSSLISPGNGIRGVSFSRGFTRFGSYDAMIKVDAYSSESFSYLTSLVIETVIHTY